MNRRYLLEHLALAGVSSLLLEVQGKNLRVYLGIKYHADQGNRPLIEDILNLLEQAGFIPCCVVRDIEKWNVVRLEPSQLMQETFEMIDSSDVVFIELSEKGVGLGIEAGYAYAKGKPIITIAKQGADISATLRGISKHVYLYATVEELPEPLINLMADI